jgi:1-phosphofructokinase
MELQTKVVTLTLNPAVDQTVRIEEFQAGAVNRVAGMAQNPGGKGVNVASALSDLGVPVLAGGFLGLENALLFESLFARKGIGDCFVRLPGATRLGLKIVDAATRQVTEINYPGLTPEPAQIERLLKVLREAAMPDTWFVLSGSLPPGIPPEIYGRMVRAIGELGAHAMVDTSGEPLRHALAQHPDIAKPNQSELEQMTGHALGSIEEVAEAASRLVAGGVGLAVISMGARGALFVSERETLLATPPKVQVQSTVGAGDTMVAGLVYARLQGLDPFETARLATAFGTHAVTRIESGIDRAAIRELETQIVVKELRTSRMLANPPPRNRASVAS